MGVFDFLFGKPQQTGQLDPQTQAARDFLMNQMLMQYSAGPVNVPTYQAVAPSGMYSGTNSLLSSLGLETVAPPSMPTTNIGGMEVYTSEPFQTQMETAYAEKYPGQYDYLRSFYMDPVTGDFGERSYGYVDPMAQVAAAVRPNVSYDDGSNARSSTNSRGGGGGGIFDTHQGPNPNGSAGYGAGGYTSFGDMFDGGGPGRSGGSFEGGLSISDIGNSIFGR